jgi:hypothetical protein
MLRRMRVMKQRWILSTALVALVGLLQSCADPYAGGLYDNGYYGNGDYPRNFAEAAVPIVIGAAVIGALASANRNCSRDCHSSRSQFHYRNWGGAYR